MDDSPLLFIISEPVGSAAANDFANRLAARDVRSWIGSLAPAGALDERTMAALRSATAALLVFDAAAAGSRHVDRHLMVARQTGVPLIPVRVEATDEGLLRQELLDAEWIDGRDPEAAADEIVRRARALARSGVDLSKAAPIGAAAAIDPPIAPMAEPIPVAHAPHATTVVVARRRGPGLTALIAGLALLLVVGGVIYTWLQSRAVADRQVASVNRTEPAPPARTPTLPPPIIEESRLPADPVIAAPAPPPAATPFPAPSGDTVAQAGPRPRAASRPVQDEDAAAAPADDGEEVDDGDSAALQTARAFYSALSRGDGFAAAQLVVPGKRDAGPLSGAALSRFYSSLRRPLRIRDLDQIDEDRVSVTYDYQLGDGRTCRGRAVVEVAPGGGLVRGIRTAGPC